MPTWVSSRFRGPLAGRSSGRHSTALTSLAVRVGVIVPLSRGDGQGRVPSWPDIRRFAQHAEGGGLDSLWVCDHFISAPPGGSPEGIHEGWSVIAALAASTSRVELGQLVTCISFRNPGLLAKMAVTVDEISGGRLTLGLGAGWYDAEYDAFGYPTDQRFSRFQEAFEIVRRLLAGERVTFAGRHHSVQDAQLLPAPSRPHSASRRRGPTARAAPDRPLGRRLEHSLVRRAGRAAPRAAPQSRSCARCGGPGPPGAASNRRHRGPRPRCAARRSERCAVRAVDRGARPDARRARGAWRRRCHRRPRAHDRAVTRPPRRSRCPSRQLSLQRRRRPPNVPLGTTRNPAGVVKRMLGRCKVRVRLHPSGQRISPRAGDLPVLAV